MKKTLRSAFLILAAAFAISMGGMCDEDPPVISEEYPPNDLIYPPENATGVSRTPTFIWHKNRATPVQAYKCFIQKPYLNDNYWVETTGDTIITCTDTLAELTMYGWFTNTITIDDKYIKTEKWLFTTGTGFNNPPLAPFDPDPEHGSSSNPLYATLNWDCYDPDGDPLTYDVWFDTFDSDSVLVGDDITDTSVDPGDLERDRRYLWKVVAFDSHGDSTTGPWWVFKTIPASNKPPVEPWGPYPVDDATDVLLDLTFSWSCSDPEDGPLTYDVAMGLAGGNLTVIGTDLIDETLAVTGLDPSTEYEWYVSATDDQSQTTPGPIWSFTTSDGSTVREVFAALSLGRNINYDGATIARNDHIFARFDSLYAPDGPINPLQPGAVSCNTFDLIWVDGSKQYAYTDYVAGYFLDPGVAYTFSVTEGDGVPALTSDFVVFSGCQPYITSPAPFSYVSMDGFDLEWHSYCSGTIDITIMDLNADSTGVYITTEDDGFYTFTAGDLSPISPSTYQLLIVLINESKKPIIATGYDPRSWIWARTLSTQLVYKQ